MSRVSTTPSIRSTAPRMPGRGAHRPRSEPPDRSYRQRLEALRRANEVRVRRSRLKADIKARRQRVSPLVLDPPEWLQSMRLWELVQCIPRLGYVKVNRLFRAYSLSPSKTVGGLSDRQRREVAKALEGR